MDPVGQKVLAWTVLSSEKNLAARFLMKIVDLSRNGRTGEVFRMDLPSGLIRQALSQSGFPGLPFKFRPDLLSVKTFVAGLFRPPQENGGIVVSVQREKTSLLWTFQNESGDFLSLSSPLIPSEKTVILLKESGSFSGNGQVHAPSLGLPMPDSAVLPALPVLSAPVPEETSERVDGPVFSYPSWVPGKTVEFSVRWIEEQEGEGDRSRKNEKPLGSKNEGTARLSFSLDIPWPEETTVSSGQSPRGPDSPGSRKRTIRLVGLYDSSGSITLISRNAPDSFRVRWEELSESLSRSLAVYPGVSLSMSFLSAGSRGSGRKPA